MERLPIIALLGKAKSGKDTSGNMMVEAVPGVALSFAEKLKRIIIEMYGLTEHQLFDEKGKEEPTTFPCLMCPECKSLEVDTEKMERDLMAICKVCRTVGNESVFKSFWTGRTIAQYLGTQGFRRIWPGVWPAYVIKAAQLELNGRRGSDMVKPLPQFAVVRDCRFRSEAQAIWEVGGEVWRIKRPGATGNVGIKGHASETEQDEIKDSECQSIIENDSTLEVLRGRVTANLNRFLTTFRGASER